MKDLSEIEIWGVQEKTEIGGFTMIGPVNRECNGCTAYVCNRADAKLIVTAVNNFDKMKEFITEYNYFIDELQSDGFTQMSTSDTRYFKKKAKQLLESLK